MKFTPYEMTIILHHYASLARFDREDAPLYAPTLKALAERGIIEWRDGIPRTTRLGDHLVEMWCLTPLPMEAWIDPRDGKRIVTDFTA